MKYSLGLPVHKVDPVGEWCTADAIGEMARAAEAAGMDAVNVTDHPLPTPSGSAEAGTTPSTRSWPSPWRRAVTSRVRLQTNLVILAYRNPFLSAKAIATLDAVSGGRVVVGTGAGYLRSEFAALGVDFDERNDLTDEAIDAMVAAWSGEPFSFDGVHFTAENAVALPRPVQRRGRRSGSAATRTAPSVERSSAVTGGYPCPAPLRRLEAATHPTARDGRRPEGTHRLSPGSLREGGAHRAGRHRVHADRGGHVP